MTKEPQSSARSQDRYRRQTLRPLNCLVFILPPLAAFQWGAATYGTTLLTPHYMHVVLRFFGATAPFLPPLLIVAVLLLQQAAHHEPFKVQPKALAGMVGESILWTFPLIAVSCMTARIARMAGMFTLPEAAEKSLQDVLQALGAGIYEEFVFRLVFLGLVMLIFVDVFEMKKEIVIYLGIVASGVLFSLCHFTTAQLPFRWGSFIFLALAGALWGGLYVFRGFGIAAGCHIVWDIYVFIFQH